MTIPQDLLISPEELARYGPTDTFPDRCESLLAQQRATWELLRKGYESLSTVRSKTFRFDGFLYKAQFNAGRIVSSSARVDEKSIRERKCFLCSANLPTGQKGFVYQQEYLVLGNPFPIFPEHLTVPHVEHRPQRILSCLSTFLAMTRAVAPRYSVVYNGPRCGASAPDHLHLQIGTGRFIPFEDDAFSVPKSRQLFLANSPKLRAFSLEQYLRTVVVLETDDVLVMEKAFRRLYDCYQKIVNEPDEPLMNLVSFMRGETYVLGVFARSKHRPARFFAEGEEKMVLSPAAVDVGGVVTLPVEKDFERVTGELLAEVFAEVSLGEEKFEALKDLLRRDLQGL
jgi:hypothetical protein